MKEKFLGWILFLITICNGQYVGAQELLTNVRLILKSMSSKEGYV